jgi:hypothetical protein
VEAKRGHGRIKEGMGEAKMRWKRRRLAGGEGVRSYKRQLEWSRTWGDVMVMSRTDVSDCPEET